MSLRVNGLEPVFTVMTVRVSDSFYEMLKSTEYRCRKELTAQFEVKQRPDIAIYSYNSKVGKTPSGCDHHPSVGEANHLPQQQLRKKGCWQM